ncbi:hypothetical protein Syun_024273 [Stephania yunnanensis]|uniref:Oxidoreductase N-terminal domain-containing protein n=1 Tax=Stephania yunnanensis TaxID=152371 RepID=A0AAP0NHF2_9MAGN
MWRRLLRHRDLQSGHGLIDVVTGTDYRETQRSCLASSYVSYSRVRLKFDEQHILVNHLALSERHYKKALSGLKTLEEDLIAGDDMNDIVPLPNLEVFPKCCYCFHVLPDFKKYTHYSDLTRKVFLKYDPYFVSSGLDEAYLDITKVCKERAISSVEDHVEGAPEESDFELRTDVITAELTPGSNDVLVKNLYLSVDPYQLNRMKKYSSSHETSNYAAPLVPDKTIDGYGVGRVVASAKVGFEKGDLVAGVIGWEEYTLVHEGTMLNKLSTREFPLSYHIGILGFNLVASQLMVELLKNKLGFDDAFNYKEESDLKSTLKRWHIICLNKGKPGLLAHYMKCAGAPRQDPTGPYRLMEEACLIQGEKEDVGFSDCYLN